MMDIETAQRLSEDFLAWADHYALDLFAWQREAFGGATRREGGRFVHRLAGVSVPRGNGKSWGASAVGAWRLCFGPPPQLILSNALDFEGARVSQDHGKRILRTHPELEQGVEVLADEIRIPATGSRWLIRSRDHLSSRGLHPDVVLYDEVGWAKDDELFASLLSSQASVSDPLFVITSTVGRRRSGPLWNVKMLAEGAESGAVNGDDDLGISL
jgi:phage terminase large subunit-like protein